MEKISKSVVIDKSKNDVLAGVFEVVQTLSFFESFSVKELDGYTVVHTNLKDWPVGQQVLHNISCKVKIFELTKKSSLVRTTLLFDLLNRGLFSRIRYKILTYPLLSSELNNYAYTFKRRLEKWT